MTYRCHGTPSGPHKSVRASQESGVVRVMVLTSLVTPRSGIPSASSILATLGWKVLQGGEGALASCMNCRLPGTFSALRICMTGSFDDRCLRETMYLCPPFFSRAEQRIPVYRKQSECLATGGRWRHWPGWTYRPSEARTELASGIPLRGAGSGVRTIARTTPVS